MCDVIVAIAVAIAITATAMQLSLSSDTDSLAAFKYDSYSVAVIEGSFRPCACMCALATPGLTHCANYDSSSVFELGWAVAGIIEY